MSIQAFGLAILAVIGLLSAYIWSVSTVEPPLEQYEPLEEDGGETEAVGAFR